MNPPSGSLPSVPFTFSNPTTDISSLLLASLAPDTLQSLVFSQALLPPVSASTKCIYDESSARLAALSMSPSAQVPFSLPLLPPSSFLSSSFPLLPGLFPSSFHSSSSLFDSNLSTTSMSMSNQSIPSAASVSVSNDQRASIPLPRKTDSTERIALSARHSPSNEMADFAEQRPRAFSSAARLQNNKKPIIEKRRKRSRAVDCEEKEAKCECSMTNESSVNGSVARKSVLRSLIGEDDNYGREYKMSPMSKEEDERIRAHIAKILHRSGTSVPTSSVSNSSTFQPTFRDDDMSDVITMSSPYRHHPKYQKYEEEKRRMTQQSQNITEDNELHSENKEKEEQKEEHVPVTA